MKDASFPWIGAILAGPYLSALGYWLLDPQQLTSGMDNPRKERLRSQLEQLYEGEYKLATGNGKHHKEAHAAALEALYDHVMVSSMTRPFRREIYMALHRLSHWLERKVRP